MSCHTRDRVVEDNNGGIGRVVRYVDESRHTRMHKGRVSDDRNALLFRFLSSCRIEAVKSRDRRAHTKSRIKGAEGRNGTERITTDVTVYGDLVLGECIEHTSVGGILHTS